MESMGARVFAELGVARFVHALRLVPQGGTQSRSGQVECRSCCYGSQTRSERDSASRSTTEGSKRSGICRQSFPSARAFNRVDGGAHVVLQIPLFGFHPFTLSFCGAVSAPSFGV